MAPALIPALDLSQGQVLFFGMGAGLVAGALVLAVGVLLTLKNTRRQSSPRKFGKKAKVLDDVLAEQAVPGQAIAAVKGEHDIFTQGGTLERRAALRRSGNPIAVLISDAKTEVQPIIGYVLNRSTGGLGLLVREPIEPGTILTVRAKDAPSEIPWVRMDVRSCRGDGGEWELGCRFQRTPPWNVLLLFG